MIRLKSIGMTVLLSAVATPVNAQSVDGLLTAFDIVTAIVGGNVTVPGIDNTQSTVDVTIGGRTYTLATTDGSPAQAFIDNIASQNEAQLLVNGDRVEVETDAASFQNTTATSDTRIRGTLENTPLDVTYTGRIEDLETADTVSAVVNSEQVQLSLPPNTNIGDVNGQTNIELVVNNEQIYNGSIDDLDNNEVLALEVANSINVINPITTLGFELQQVQQGRAIGTSRARVSSVLHTPTGVANGMETASFSGIDPNQQLVFSSEETGQVLGSSVAQAPGTPFNEARMAVWSELDYADFSNDDPAFRSEGDMVSFTLGVDALLDDQFLVGASAGYDYLDAKGGGSLNNALEMDVINLSAYGAASMMDGRFVPEVAVNVGLIDADVTSATGGTGETDGYSIVGRLGGTVQQQVNNGNAVVGAFGGIELGYQELEGFTDSLNVVVEPSETPLGEVDLGVRGAVDVTPGFTIIGSAAYTFDFSDELESNVYLDALSEDYVELSAAASWNATNQLSVNFGGSTKLGMDDREEYIVGGGATFRF